MSKEIVMEYDDKGNYKTKEDVDLSSKVVFALINYLLADAQSSPEEIEDFVNGSIAHSVVLEAIQGLLSIPMLRVAIDIVGPVSAKTKVDGKKCTVEIKNSKIEGYVITKIHDDKHLYGVYGTGMDGEFMIGDVFDDESVEERTKMTEEEVYEKYIEERDDEFAMFAIHQVIDELKNIIIERLEEGAITLRKLNKA